MTSVTPLLAKANTEAKARVAIFLSGSGSNAEKILQQERRMGPDAPFETVVLVTDAPETSRAGELGRTFDLPVIANDIRSFYRAKGETRVSIATPEGQTLREEWTCELREQLAPYRIDFGILAGFVPLTNLVGDFPCLNVHPGDLTYLKDGQRYLVGLHTVPIERAILEGLGHLRSSVIQALPYSGQGDDMDNGPILGISPPVPIDLQGSTLEELLQCVDTRPEKRPKSGFGDRLEELAEHNQNLLKEGGDWIVFPPVVMDFARGRFGVETGALHYRTGNKWLPIETVVYGRGEKEVLFRGE